MNSIFFIYIHSLVIASYLPFCIKSVIIFFNFSSDICATKTINLINLCKVHTFEINMSYHKTFNI